jgi:hypothetical protein
MGIYSCAIPPRLIFKPLGVLPGIRIYENLIRIQNNFLYLDRKENGDYTLDAKSVNSHLQICSGERQCHLLFTLRLPPVYGRCHTTGSETVVNIYYRHSRRTAVQHSQQGCYAAK